MLCHNVKTMHKQQYVPIGLLYKTLPPMDKVGVWPIDACDGAMPDRKRWTSFLSPSRFKGINTLQVHGSMVGYIKHNTIL